MWTDGVDAWMAWETFWSQRRKTTSWLLRWRRGTESPTLGMNNLMNDPGEGTQSKRKAHACIVNHL
eukprot:CAMPEP_0171308952 /NCGR_PEP_ID=MMETSP0816-20121228/19084_1 /TAXON_ID=420281 /ORGANISM="Proboscia inermis, Strain CCAP1064/1" /LENGTH=65 /DNA_ID=CAMNT_0011792173 /DNA_START=45 /DNA_END=239 /DNA_ORIENTATION=+